MAPHLAAKVTSYLLSKTLLSFRLKTSSLHVLTPTQELLAVSLKLGARLILVLLSEMIVVVEPQIAHLRLPITSALLNYQLA